MRHRKSGRKLNRTSSHRKALMRTLASELFEHKRIHTTLAKAKELRPYSEKLITKAKKALSREQQGLLPEGSTIDVHTRRIVYKDIRKKHVLEMLFDEIAPAVMDRNGGYTRVVKTGRRRGDGGETALIELVDWNTDQDTSFQKKKHVKAGKGNTQVSTPATEAKGAGAAKTKKAASDEAIDDGADDAADQEVVDTATDADTSAADNSGTDTAQDYIEDSKDSGSAADESAEAKNETTAEEIVEETTGEVSEDTETDGTLQAVEEVDPVGVSNDSDFEEVIASNDGTPPEDTKSEDNASDKGDSGADVDEDEKKQS